MEDEMDSQRPRKRSTSGRAIARRIAAQAVRDQLEIARANGDDLYLFRRHREAQRRAAERRDAAIAVATTQYEAAVTKAKDTYEKVIAVVLPQQSDALRRMKQRGVSDADLGTWSEMPVGELRKLLGSGRSAASTGKSKRARPSPARDDDRSAEVSEREDAAGLSERGGKQPPQYGRADDPRGEAGTPHAVLDGEYNVPGQPQHDTGQQPDGMGGGSSVGEQGQREDGVDDEQDSADPGEGGKQ
ncbi:hypothetical protein [Nocardia terpenica]|uniref:Uncharacterized protein n=1 Tax=Nocardia terpenica TaxID=455432 RepID=A0A161WF76_9NOCA|nr:hypothetical protein [Nocardia terpenica]KZM75569.1 hypothetical protein AWN90_19530 [Nocardia terpenica]NQE86050.1 hypothetical protein [Nocardia terpenica]